MLTLRLYFKKPSLSLNAVFLSWLHLLLIPHAQRYHGCLDSGDSSLTFSAATLSQLYYRLFPQHKETATCPWKSVSEVLITAATSSNIQYPSCLCSSQTHVVQKWFVSIDDVIIIIFFLPEINSVIFFSCWNIICKLGYDTCCLL